jgi:DNA polymerase-3 subunit beta
MEFRIAKDELIRALSRVQGIVEKRSTNPIIANVLLEAGSDGMKVSATDTEVSLVGHYAIECIEPGRLTLGAKQLYEIARLVPTDTVSFRLPAGSFMMEISSGKAQFKVLGLAADDFPPIADGSDGGGLELDAGDLKALVDKTLFSISRAVGVTCASSPRTGTGCPWRVVRSRAPGRPRAACCCPRRVSRSCGSSSTWGTVPGASS